MGHLSLPASKRSPRQWKLLDLVIAVLLGLISLFFLLVFTRLGDSLATSGRQSLLLASCDHARLVAAVESGRLYPSLIESCPDDYADHMPCENPRRNSQLSS